MGHWSYDCDFGPPKKCEHGLLAGGRCYACVFDALRILWHEQEALKTERDRLRTENNRLSDAVIAWESASGLVTSAGDPDGLDPAIAQKYWEGVEAERAALRAAFAELWARLDDGLYGDVAAILTKHDIAPESFGT